MHQIVVSIWNRPSWQHADRETYARLATLRTAVGKAAAAVDSAKLDANGLIKGIFVAPEYYFSDLHAGQNVGGTDRQRGISATTHNTLRNQLISKLSTDFRRILIFPGSIAWRKTFDLNAFLAAYQYYEARAKYRPMNDAEVVGMIKSAWSLDDAGVQDIRTNDLPLYNQMVAYVRLASEVDPKVMQQRERLNAGFAPTRVLYNTVYGLLNGKVALSYSKQGNFHEEFGDNNQIFAPGGRSGVNEVEGIRIGLEVCLDHNFGFLVKQARANRPVDLQVVLSDWVILDTQHIAVRDGGYFIHASTVDKYQTDQIHGVWKWDGGNLVPAAKLGEDTIDGAKLSHWRIDLDNPDAFGLADTFMSAP